MFESADETEVEFYDDRWALKRMANIQAILYELAKAEITERERARYYKFGERLFHGLQKQLKESNKNGL